MEKITTITVSPQTLALVKELKVHPRVTNEEVISNLVKEVKELRKWKTKSK
jgi:hypothetical protein